MSTTAEVAGAGAVPEAAVENELHKGASAARAIKSVMSGSLLLQGLAMVSGVELARGLGLTGRGELAAAILWPTMIGGIGVLGLEEAVTFHIASARERRDVGRLFGSALALCAIQALIFSVIAVVVVPLALHKHTSTTITSGLIFSAFVSMNMFGLTINGMLNGLHRYTAYNAARVSIGVAIVAAQTVLLAVGAFRVETIVIAMTGCYVACLLFDCVLGYRARPGRLSVDRKVMRSIFLYGAKSHTSNTSSYLNQRLDQLVISVFLTARQLGVYVVAVTFTLFTSLLGASVMVAALPNIAKIDDLQEQARVGRRFVSLTLIAAIIASAPVIVLAPWLIQIFFGHAFSIGANITRVTAIASISFATTRALEGVLRGMGRPLTAGSAEFVALGGTIGGLAVLLPTLGLIGAAWATLASYSISGLWMAWRIKRITGMPMSRLFTPDRESIRLIRQGFARLSRSRRRGVILDPMSGANEAAAGQGQSDNGAFEGVAIPPLEYSPEPELTLPPGGLWAAVGAKLYENSSEAATPEQPDDQAQPAEAPVEATPAEVAATAEEPAADPRGTVRGMSFDEAKAIEWLPPREYGLWELIWSDYIAWFGWREESLTKQRVMFGPRMLVNSSMHACLLVRLLQGTPMYLTWFWRRLLITLHGCDFQPYCRIGPGLRMPHPIGILVGHGVLGRNVTLQHHITLSAVTTNWRTGESPGWFQVGDDVTIFTGAVIAGPIAIGDSAVIGANSLVVRDIPAGHIVIGGRTRPTTEAERQGLG